MQALNENVVVSDAIDDHVSLVGGNTDRAPTLKPLPDRHRMRGEKLKRRLETLEIPVGMRHAKGSRTLGVKVFDILDGSRAEAVRHLPFKAFRRASARISGTRQGDSPLASPSSIHCFIVAMS